MSAQCKRLILERYIGGELNGPEETALRRHLDSCNECSSYLAELQARKAEFLLRHPFSSFTRAHAPVRLLPWYSKIFQVVLRPSLAPAYIAAVLLIALIPLHRISIEEKVRFKGGNTISFLYERNGIISEGTTQLLFRPGDRIQILYSVSKKGYVTLISVDTKGIVSFYHPNTGSEFCSVIAEAGERRPFPGSIVLDDTPGGELVIALFSDSQLATAEVAEWAKQRFKECPDLNRLKDRLKTRHGQLEAKIAALLLRKE